jgi:hypothetical protein
MPHVASADRFFPLAGLTALLALSCGAARADEREISASEHVQSYVINTLTPNAPVVGYRDLKAVLQRWNQDEARRTAKFNADADAAVAAAQAKGAPPQAPAPTAPAATPPGAPIDAATLQTPEFQARLQRGDPVAVQQAMAYIAQMRAGVMAGVPGGGGAPAPAAAPPVSLAQAAPGGSPLAKALGMQANPQVGVELSKVDPGNAPPAPLYANIASGIVKLFQYHNADHHIKSIPLGGPDGDVNVVDDDDPAWRGRIVPVDQAIAANHRMHAAVADARAPAPKAPAVAATTAPANGAWQPTQLPARMGDGWIRLGYVGEPLSHRSDRAAAGAPQPRVTVSLEILDQALRAGDELRASSSQQGDRQFMRAVVVTAGDQVYDFNKAGDAVEVRIATDAARRIVGWRIRAARSTDNDNHYIRLFGPGFEHDNERDPARFGVGAVGGECPASATDIVFDRDGTVAGVDGSATRLFMQSCAPGSWQLR